MLKKANLLFLGGGALASGIGPVGGSVRLGIPFCAFRSYSLMYNAGPKCLVPEVVEVDVNIEMAGLQT
jgi:hypothetical protein